MPSKKRIDSNVISITRVYDAPVARVWEAWVDPKQVAEWWGPRGFTITSKSKEVKAGGKWIYTMHGPDGKDWPNYTTFLEVVEHQKLVYDHGATDEHGPLFRVTVKFSDVGGKTKMEMQMALPTVEEAEKTRKFIREAGGDATWDRLAEYLAKRQSDKVHFVINRTFETSLERMFEAWTNPKDFAAWLGPTGSTMEFIRVDIREGGSGFYKMTNADGSIMHGTVSYLSLEKPNRIVYVQNFADANEKVTRHPLSPLWPEKMKTVVDFASEGPTTTRVTVTWEPYGQLAREEVETFANARTGMTGGWTGSFDKLEAYLDSN